VKSKLVSVSDAAALVQPGSTLVVGGALLRRQPMALVHELVRCSVRDLDLVTWASSLATDMLVGAGCVRSWEGIYVGLWWYGLAPNFRRAVEQGAITVTDHSESYMTSRFRAAAMGLPFLPVQPIRGTGTTERDDVRSVTCPYTGTELHTVAAVEADCTILHGYVGDEYGNVAWPVHRDSDDVDLIMAAGARTLVVSVEKIVPHEVITKHPNLTYIPHVKVDAVCEAPFGAFPGSCDTVYDEDDRELETWAAAGRDPDSFRAYLQDTVLASPDHGAFVERLGRVRTERLEVVQ